jgi:hypothetical protein
MRLSFTPAWVAFGLLAVAALLGPGLLEAGTIGWADMAADASGSMQSAASEAVPLFVGAGLLAGAWHLPGMVTGLTATGLATYGAANSDQVQGIIGGGGAGGLITDVVVQAFCTVCSLQPLVG